MRHADFPTSTQGGLTTGAPFGFVIRIADPEDPPEGCAVIWLSDGTESGDAGDIMVKITSGGVTVMTTLVDFSAL